ncbi:RNA polymerase III subunit RPC82 helix-turn-helix domain-containing protein [Schizophyllum amplum]|uniref:DNA-directed RNA polymerase III subunit RPC3 n=1 Tax=Schizophyllum amplum TaxID=97359 RepID=A0A550C3J9_9AGAR|nr:RNA polymerase III subunit RPC82 helix-turn-helix domain-containing protein [Auriculariopsis ampla]
MADAQIARLCTQIINSHFGPLSAKVAEALLTLGRLPVPHIVRATGLRPRTVRATLLVLLQHNVLWYALDPIDGEVLEISPEECMLRLRFGRAVWQAGQLFGQSGSDIVQMVLDHGKLRPPDIVPGCRRPTRKAAVHRQVLHKLVTLAYLKPSTAKRHLSPRDKAIKYELEEKAKISGFPTAKEVREAKEAAETRLKREEDEDASCGMKRKAKEQNGHRPSKIRDDVYFRVNFDKFNTHIRNQVKKAARERFNEGAATVMRAVLKATESTQTSLNDERSDPASIGNIILQVADDADLTSGLVVSSSKTSKSTCTKHYLDLLACADNPTNEAARLPSSPTARKSRRSDVCSRRRPGETRDNGLRVVRLLLGGGKLDEKQVARGVMLPAKDVRALLAALAADSLVSTQEVPKTATGIRLGRSTSGAHVDETKAYAMLLGELYKTLYNIGVRRQAEQEEPMVRAVLEKRQRSDVRADEGLLTRLDREILAEWERKEEKLTVLEMRVEECVFLCATSACWARRRVEIGAELRPNSSRAAFV